MTLRAVVKQGLVTVFARGPGGALARAVTGPLATIFMLHRFRDATLGNDGTDPVALRTSLRALAASGVRFERLVDLIEHLASGRPLEAHTVAFTVDDGYRDFLAAGAPVFLEERVPVTVFLTTRFIDQAQWQWWDRIEAAVTGAGAGRVSLMLGGRRVEESWGPQTLAATAKRLTMACEFLPDEERRAAVAEIERAAGASLGTVPPPGYGALSWDEVRALSSRGIDFAPHTLTHPILTRVSDGTARQEIAGSWDKLRTELPAAVPVFCYPNGTADAWSRREADIVRDAGMKAATAVRLAHATPELANGDGRWSLPRFGYDTRPGNAVQSATGLWQLSTVVRSGLAALRGS